MGRILEEFVSFPIRKTFMDDLADRLAHLDSMVALENIPAHVDSSRALRDRPVSHGQGLVLRQLLAAGHDDGYGARRNHFYKVIAEKGIDHLPDNQRAVYVLNIYDGMKISEISHTLHLNYKSVEHKLGQARKEIRNYIRRMLA